MANIKMTGKGFKPKNQNSPVGVKPFLKSLKSKKAFRERLEELQTNKEVLNLPLVKSARKKLIKLLK